MITTHFLPSLEILSGPFQCNKSLIIVPISRGEARYVGVGLHDL